jgi:hypothetical protein
MRHKKYDFRTAFIDLLINVLTGMVFLFMITTLMIQTKVKKEDEGVKKDAQYVIQIAWPNNMDCDVDIWVRDPQNRVVSYQAKDVGVMHIERDDQGWVNDLMTYLKLQPSQQLNNSETWVLRGKMAGKFTVNLHLYACGHDGKAVPMGTAYDVPVTIELTKLNPDLKKVLVETITLKKVWQEITAFNFVLDGQNNITTITREQVDLVKEKK